jgi:hypothetical protein
MSRGKPVLRLLHSNVARGKSESRPGVTQLKPAIGPASHLGSAKHPPVTGDKNTIDPLRGFSESAAGR